MADVCIVALSTIGILPSLPGLLATGHAATRLARTPGWLGNRWLDRWLET